MRGCAILLDATPVALVGMGIRMQDATPTWRYACEKVGEVFAVDNATNVLPMYVKWLSRDANTRRGLMNLGETGAQCTNHTQV